MRRVAVLNSELLSLVQLLDYDYRVALGRRRAWYPFTVDFCDRHDGAA